MTDGFDTSKNTVNMILIKVKHFSLLNQDAKHVGSQMGINESIIGFYSNSSWIDFTTVLF